MNQRPISLRSLRFSDKNGNLILAESYELIFTSYEDVEKFIQSRYKYWRKLLNKHLVIAPEMNETIEELGVKRVFMLAAKFRGISEKDIFDRRGNAEIIEARRMAIMICYRKGVTKSVIAKASGFTHSTIIHHINKYYHLRAYDKAFDEKYDHLEDQVLTKLSNESEKV